MAENNKKILVIEDELPMLKALTEALTQKGYEVLGATDGEEGLRMAIKGEPDLILLDILMPKMDGMEMITKLRENTWGKGVPVIILTNVSPDSDATIKAVVDNQPSYYLVKSDTTLEEVVEKAGEILKA